MHMKSSAMIQIWETSCQCVMTSRKRTKECWAHWLRPSLGGVSRLEFMLTPSFHAEFGSCRESGSWIYGAVWCLCQRGTPSKRNMSLKEKWRGQGEVLDHVYQGNGLMVSTSHVVAGSIPAFSTCCPFMFSLRVPVGGGGWQGDSYLCTVQTNKTSTNCVHLFGK